MVDLSQKLNLPSSAISSDCQESTEYCPVAGLPIYTRPEWTNIYFGSNYLLTLKIAGDSILLCEAYGNAVLKDAQEALKITSKVVSEVFGNSRYVQLENYSQLRSYSLDARIYYINHMKNRNKMLALIFHSVPLMLKMTIQLGKRIYQTNFDVLLSANYQEAVTHAKRVLATHRRNMASYASDQNEHPLTQDQPELRQTCAITGWPITAKNDWSAVPLGSMGFVGFRIVGGNILLSSFSGTIDTCQAAEYIKTRNQIIQQLLINDKKMIGLYDFTNLENPLFSAYSFINYIITHSKQLSGNIAFGLNKPFFYPNVLIRTIAKIKPVKTYEEAILKSIKILKQKGITNNQLPYHVVTNKEWELVLEGFRLRFEIINSEIIHSIPNGRLGPSHLPFVLKLREKVIQELIKRGEFRYLIINTANFKSVTPQIRNIYGKSLRDIHKKYGFRTFYYYGESKFAQTALNLAKPFLPFKVQAAETLEHALKLIVADKKKGDARPPKNLIQKILPGYRETQQHVNDVMSFLGNINWEKDGFDGVMNYPPSHPFSPVFDSIRFIKKDLDFLFREKSQAQIANTEISDFFDNMSHEFRTPMHGIINFSRFGIDRCLLAPREKLLEYFSEINKCAHQVMDLMEEFFEISELENNRVIYHMDKHDILKIIESIILNLSDEAKEKNLSIMVHHPEISTCAVFDAQKIYRVIGILLSNAIEHTHNGGKISIFFEKNDITINLAVVEAITLNIVYEGAEIADDKHEPVLNEFYENSLPKSQIGSNSLGLSICKKIIDYHSGKIRIERNKNGRGNVFAVALPCEKSSKNT